MALNEPCIHKSVASAKKEDATDVIANERI